MKSEESKKQERKQYAKRGDRSQKMVTVRLDLDLVDYLSMKPNKGRFINDCIRKVIEDEKNSNL